MRWLALVAISVGCHTPRSGGADALQPPIDVVPPLADAGCHADGVEALMRCVDPSRIAEDTRAFAVERPPGSAGHATVRRACRERLASLGYQVEEQPYPTGINVLAKRRGVTTAAELVVVSAHYDGKADCPAADDNASGVAALLEVARVLASGRFSRTITIACFDGGELDQAGSTAFVAALEGDVVGAVALDSVAYANPDPGTQRVPEGFERLFPDQALALLESDDRGDFATIVADSRTREWALRTQRSGVALPVHLLVLTEAVKAQQRPLHRSDHVSFWNADRPALLITDTGPFRNPHAGCETGLDTPEALDFTFAAELTRLAVFAAVDQLELRSPTQGFAQ